VTDGGQLTRRGHCLGQGIAFLFGTLNLVGNPFLIFIALVVWIGGAQESAMTR
jgi:hypothetical protein